MTDMIENPGLNFKFYLSVDEGYQEVCRQCFRETLAECNDFITMVLEYKAKYTKSKYGAIHKKILEISQNSFFFIIIF